MGRLRDRGGLMTAMLLLFVFMGIFGGYAAGRLYKTFKVSAPRSHLCISKAAPQDHCFSSGCAGGGCC